MLPSNKVNEDQGLKNRGWRRAKLGDLLEFKNGLNYTTNDDGEEVLIVGVGDFKNNFYIDETKLSSIRVNALPNDYLMRKGDFVFVRSNGNKALIGRVLYAKDVSNRLTHSGFTIRARKKSDLIRDEYCATYCSSHLIKKQFMTKGGGSNINNLNQKLLSDIEIKVPPLLEQDKILKVLNAWYEAIDLLERLIEQKKEQKKGLMQKLLSGEIRLPGFDKEWNKKRIGDLIEESKVVSNSPKLDKRITVRLNLKGVCKRETTSVEKEGATTQYIRTTGQFIYGKQNLHKGAFGLIPKELNGFQSSSDIPAFDFKEGVDGLWFYYYFSRERFFTDLENISSGTGSKRIQPKELYKLKLKLPPFEEQQKQSQILACIDKEINLLEKKLEKYKEQRQGLMQLLLTGRVRVKV